MGRRAETTPAHVSAARKRWLETEIREVARNLRDAEADHSWQAVAALRRQRQSLRSELDTEKEKLAELQRLDRVRADVTTLSPEAAVARLRQAVGRLPLQVVIAIEEDLRERRGR